MKKSLLVPALVALGTCIGCNTGSDDVTRAETKYKQAQRDAEKMVTKAQQEGAENTHETRKVVLDDINSKKSDVKEAVTDGNSALARERSEADQAIREGDQKIQEAEARKQIDLAEAKVAADGKIADAKREMELTRRSAILPRGVLGLNSDLFRHYVQHVADRRLERIGLPTQYNSQNPFPWMSETIDLSKEKNFFETRVTEYQSAGALNWD